MKKKIVFYAPRSRKKIEEKTFNSIKYIYTYAENLLMTLEIIILMQQYEQQQKNKENNRL